MMSRGNQTPVLAAHRSFSDLAGQRHLRFELAIAVLCLGLAASFALLVRSASPGIVLIPTSYGLLLALLLVPFPQADYALAFCIVAPFPLLPPFASLPNLPVGIGVIGVALARMVLTANVRLRPGWFLPLAFLWALIVIGTLLAPWPPFSVWLRPAAILAVAAASSVLGVLVWTDPGRRTRWLEGLMWLLLASAATGLAVFLLQYVQHATSVVNRLANLLGMLRGDAAGQKFAVANNWLIWSQTVTLRAVSPLFPSPNNLGGLIGLLFPFAIVGTIYGTAKRARIVAALALSAGVAGLVLTYSRSSEVAAGATGALMGLLLFLGCRSARTDAETRATTRTGILIASAAIVIGLGLGGVGFLTAHGSVSNDPGLRPDPGSRLTDPLGDPSVTTRIEIAETSVQHLRSDPLHGAGLGNWAISANQGARAYVHNVYLEYGAAAGIFGLAWAVALVFLPIAAGWLAARRRQAVQERALAVAAAGAGLFAAVQFLFDDNMLNPQYAWLLALVVGLSVGAWKSSEHPKSV